jgi:hypothetical protein
MLQVAESRREAALSSYVTEQLQYSKFWKLLEFSEKLEKLLKVGVKPWGDPGELLSPAAVLEASTLYPMRPHTYLACSVTVPPPAGAPVGTCPPSMGSRLCPLLSPWPS